MRSGRKAVEVEQRYNPSLQEKADKIKAWLPDLSKEELLEIEFLVKHIRTSKRTAHLVIDAELIYESIRSELKLRYNQEILTWQLFTYREPALYEKLEFVTNKTVPWVETVMKPHTLSRAQKVQVYGIFTELVADALERAGIVVIVATILSFYERLPSLVDKAFPEYSRSGLMYTLLLWR